MKCPTCGAMAYVIGLSNESYPASFGCQDYGREHWFSSDSADARQAEIEARGRSVANGAAYFGAPEGESK